jgi:hypothetical protein
MEALNTDICPSKPHQVLAISAARQNFLVGALLEQSQQHTKKKTHASKLYICIYVGEYKASLGV